MNFEPKYEVDYSARDPQQDVDKLFYQRWSPRSLIKQDIPLEVLTTIFDAARWSPSCGNEQPWLFVTASKKEELAICNELLEERNQRWANNASVLGFLFGKRTFSKNGKINTYASFDCGAACLAIALQAAKFGLYVHVMAGIHKEKVYGTLGVSKETYETICGFSISALDLPNKLPDDLANREKPPARKPLTEIWNHGLKQELQ